MDQRSKKIRQVFFFGLLLIALVLSFFIFSPFLTSLVLAVVFAVILEPFFNFFIGKLRFPRSLASLATILILIILIALPLTFLGRELLLQSRDLFQSITAENFTSLIPPKVTTTIESVFPGTLDSFTPSFTDIAEKVGTNVGAIFKGTFQTLFTLILSLVALFYFLKDGEQFKKSLIALSPLTDDYDTTIVSRLKKAINSVIRGSLTIALIQGCLAGAGMAVFGVPHPALWGAMTALTALIPSIGTSIVLVPAVIFLFATGMPIHAFGLLIWSAIIVGTIDNFLNPILVGRGVNIHPFFILLSVLGGISFFGPIGFMLGPMILSFLFTLLDIYRLDFDGN